MAKNKVTAKPPGNQTIQEKIARFKISFFKKQLELYGIPMVLTFIAFLLLVSLLLPKDRFQQTKEELARVPDDFEAHLVLAEEFLKNNQIEAAEKELRLAQALEPDDYRLQELWQKAQEADPEKIQQLIQNWEKIVSEKPDYRDGHLQLAILNYKLGNENQAQKHLEEAIVLDPNFEPTKELEKTINEAR